MRVEDYGGSRWDEGPRHNRPGKEDVLRYDCPACGARPQHWCQRVIGTDLADNSYSRRMMAEGTPPSHRIRYKKAQFPWLPVPWLEQLVEAERNGQRAPDGAAMAGRMARLAATASSPPAVTLVRCPVHKVPKGTRCPVGGGYCPPRVRKLALRVGYQR
jgi:hypothetical protein